MQGWRKYRVLAVHNNGISATRVGYTLSVTYRIQQTRHHCQQQYRRARTAAAIFVIIVTDK